MILDFINGQFILMHHKFSKTIINFKEAAIIITAPFNYKKH